MPNAFTPDNNRLNDALKPVVSGTLKQYHLSIYNRWGQLVFTSKDPATGWDGTMRGIPQNSDTYVWICSYQLDGENAKVEKGTVMLIR